MAAGTLRDAENWDTVDNPGATFKGVCGRKFQDS